MSTDRDARRLALALLRLREAGDHHGVALLVASLDAKEARAVLLAQLENTSALLAGLFEEIRESRLPEIAERFGQPREQVVADHLASLIARLVLAEGE
ncbi:hypothetical protein [Streptosporangium sp. NPDC006930]|uniref:hypothetical protein n=1 Tax=Streptosporangium sp. NPDC006930 TaxID=3154783 RepID=UPI00341C3BAD